MPIINANRVVQVYLPFVAVVIGLCFVATYTINKPARILVRHSGYTGGGSDAYLSGQGARLDN